jgi:hypothetical protein
MSGVSPIRTTEAAPPTQPVPSRQQPGEPGAARAATAGPPGPDELRARPGSAAGAVSEVRAALPTAGRAQAGSGGAAVPFKPGSDAAPIMSALNRTRDTEGASFLAVGYSPTGGGHTGRTLDIVQHALDEGSLKRDSTVILYAPIPWNNNPRSPKLDALAANLTQRGITVVMAEADKSVMGFLKQGQADDAKILHRMATLPQRQAGPDAASTIADCKVFRREGDFQALPGISAKDLMRSIGDAVGAEAMKSKFRVLTDSEPALQKAAAESGVPANSRVDQQNHAVVFDLDDVQATLHNPAHAFMSKVLSGQGERVSHIALGAKNTLGAMKDLPGQLGLDASSTKQEVLHAVSAQLLDKSDPVTLVPGARPVGTMKGTAIKNADDVKNLVYVYAHDDTEAIAKRVKDGIDTQRPGYADTMFIFCGNPAKFGGLNPMHMAYLADGDGVTTAGAGTNGEFAYLHKAGGAQSGLLVLPIKGHNEQGANANQLATKEDATKAFVTNHPPSDTAGLHGAVDAFVEKESLRAGSKFASGTLAPMLSAVASDDSYTKQAHDLLFKADAVPDQLGQRIAGLEQQLTGSDLMKANRKFVKVIFQALEQHVAHLDAGDATTPELSITLKKKDGEAARFADLHALAATLNDDAALGKLLAFPAGKPMDDATVVLLGKTRELVNDILKLAPHQSDDTAKMGAHDLKETYGEKYTTGF